MRYDIDYQNPCHVHFIGIGGVSMSGLAYILKKRGFTVSGSDATAGPQTKRLEADGFTVFIGHDAAHITSDISMVVYNAAIHPDNPEYACATKLGIPLLTRGELLGQIMQHYPISIGVSGTHGKTTTTSFLAHMLLEADLDPTISVGGDLKRIDGTIQIGDSPVFLTEACEYTNSFLSLYPFLEVILNIEEDHLDFFKDLADIRNSFRQYFTHIPAEGALLIHSGITDIDTLTKDLACRVVTFGIEDAQADYEAKNLKLVPGTPNYTFEVYHQGSFLLEATLHVPGIHNVCNALAAIAAADLLSISSDTICKALTDFSGTGRRFEKRGTFHGAQVVDDYAHHPQEITATLSAAQNYPHGDVWCIFQPHTYSRTKLLFDDFVTALALADHIVLAEIYPARETDTLGMHASLLCKELKALGKDAHYFDTFEEIERFLSEQTINGDLLITMGAGNITNLGKTLVSREDA